MAPSFGGLFSSHLGGVQSCWAPDGCQYMVVFPQRETRWPKVQGGGGGAWISGIEAGEQWGKEKAVNEVGGEQKVGFICWMSAKVPFMWAAGF